MFRGKRVCKQSPGISYDAFMKKNDNSITFYKLCHASSSSFLNQSFANDDSLILAFSYFSRPDFTFRKRTKSSTSKRIGSGVFSISLISSSLVFMEFFSPYHYCFDDFLIPLILWLVYYEFRRYRYHLHQPPFTIAFPLSPFFLLWAMSFLPIAHYPLPRAYCFSLLLPVRTAKSAAENYDRN